MNPFQAAPESKKMLTLAGVYLAVIANLMVSSSNATLLPVAAADFGVPELYGVAQSVSGVLGLCIMPVFGFIAARNPHLKRLLVGIGLGAGALVILCRALAPNFWFIIISNVFWGLVAAGIFVVGFTIIRDMFDAKRAGFYLGLNGTMMSIAMVAGPFLSGLVIDNIGWRVWCWIVFAFLALAFVFVVVLGIKATKEECKDMAVEGGSFDVPGTIAVTVFLACTILVLSMGNSYIPFGSPLSYGMIAVAVVALVALVFVVRKKGDDAVVPASAIKDRNALILASQNFLHNLGQMSINFFVPSFVMYQLATDPIVQTLGPAVAGGMVTVCLAFLGIFLGPVFGKMIAKEGSAKGTLLIANIVRVAVMAALLFLLKPGTPALVIFAIIFIGGIYNSGNSVAMSAGPQIQLKPELRVTGNSIVQLGQNLGAGIGVPLFTVIITSDPVNGMSTCIMVSLACFIVQLILGLLLKKEAQPEQAA